MTKIPQIFQVILPRTSEIQQKQMLVNLSEIWSKHRNFYCAVDVKFEPCNKFIFSLEISHV